MTSDSFEWLNIYMCYPLMWNVTQEYTTTWVRPGREFHTPHYI